MISIIETRVENAVENLLAKPNLRKLVEEYLKGPPETQFAGGLFDDLKSNKPNVVEASDLVAVSLLDVRFGANAVKKLLDEEFITREISEIPSNQDLWEVNEDVLENLEKAFLKLKGLEGVGRTKATKLLARKRPRVAPISDSVVEKFYGLPEWEHLRPLRRLLESNSSYVKQIKDLVEPQIGYVPTVLRILDISIWMTGSNSRAARNCRKKFDFS